jgi:hypothetical protein
VGKRAETGKTGTRRAAGRGNGSERGVSGLWNQVAVKEDGSRQAVIELGKPRCGMGGAVSGVEVKRANYDST